MTGINDCFYSVRGFLGSEPGWVGSEHCRRDLQSILRCLQCCSHCSDRMWLRSHWLNRGIVKPCTVCLGWLYQLHFYTVRGGLTDTTMRKHSHAHTFTHSHVQAVAWASSDWVYFECVVQSLAPAVYILKCPSSELLYPKLLSVVNTPESKPRKEVSVWKCACMLLCCINGIQTFHVL